MTDMWRKYTLIQKRNWKQRTSCYLERYNLQCVRMEMKLLCLEILLLMCCATTALPTEGARRYYTDYTGRRCRRCPPGQYQADCSECSACPTGYFTSQWNSEESCLPCNRDCRKEFNLQVVQECSPVSDVLCSCIEGFSCKNFDSTMEPCKFCTVDAPPTLPPALPMNQTESSETICAPGTLLNVSSGNCDLQNNESPTNTPLRRLDAGERQLWWCVGLIVLLVIFLITPVIVIWRCREGRGLKQLFTLCADGSHKGENEAIAQTGVTAGQLYSKEAHWNANPLTNPNKVNHTDLPISMDQASKATGNFGPFHIYSAGAVFVSLLNHFANPEGETEGARQPQKEETPPPSSPPIHLSEEERDAERDCIFFPLQEQGKESHLSKEEEMHCQQNDK